MTQVFGATIGAGNLLDLNVFGSTIKSTQQVEELIFNPVGVGSGIMVDELMPASISDVDIPEFKASYSDEEKEEAYTKYSELSDDEKAEIHKAYENAIKKYNETKLQESVMMCVNFKGTTFEEFLEQYPEYKEAVSIMGPIAADYNDKMQAAAEDYRKDTPWYKKIGERFGLNDGRDEAIKKAQEEFIKEHPGCESIVDFAKEQNKTILDKLKELFL